MPSLNVAPYVRECIESVLGQTLREIEIICVDAGSTDGTLEILREYAEKDSRITLIVSDKKSYGYQMNLGLNVATGKYVGIVETDDRVRENMYETLYGLAEQNAVDIIKADYDNLYGEGEGQYTKTIRLLDDLKRYERNWTPSQNPWLFYVPMMNCLGLFRGDFLRRNGIRHNETPGASHQDMGFWFQTFSLAQSVYFHYEPFYQYRQDNMDSSINNHTKVGCVRDEYQFIFEFLKRHSEVREWVAPIYYHRMFGSFYFTYGKLVDYLKPVFLKLFSDEFKNMEREQDFTLVRFSPNEKKIALQIMENPQGYYLTQQGLYNEENKRLMEALDKYKRKVNYYQEELRRCTGEMGSRQDERAPAVTVVIPIYNTEAYLRECLESILNQTLSDIEVICVNDGSTDGSLNILEETAARDSRVQVISQVNMGQSAARNAGIRRAHGKYIYFMDSDDRLVPHALERLCQTAEEQELDILYFDGVSFFDSPALEKEYGNMRDTYQRPREYGGIYRGEELFYMFEKSHSYRVSPCLQFIRRDFLMGKEIWFLEGIIYEDNLFSMQCILSAHRTSHRKEALFQRRIREGSTTTATKQYKHFYGYFTCYCQMLFFLMEKRLPKKYEDVAFYEINAIRNTTLRYYKSLPQAEAEKMNQMSAVEKMIFEYLLLNTEGSNRTSSTELFSQAVEQNEFRKEISRIHQSASYRIGRSITFFPRKIRGLVRCYHEHGVRYTLHRIKVHLLGKAK